jgi:hypothetical protein
MSDGSDLSGGEGLVVYEGNWPSNVSHDAKYTVRTERGQYVVCVEYETPDGDKWYPTTVVHEALVEKVNQIKLAVTGKAGGSFYINEFQQVLVPVGTPVIYYYAGEYCVPLIFDFDGQQLSGQAYTLDGAPLAPGSKWEGVHPGIPYYVTADGRDIAYKKEIWRGKVRGERTIRLSDFVGADRAAALAAKFFAVMGLGGGGFYINEFRQLFTGMPYRYLGALATSDPWFPRPHAKP